MRIAIVSDIHGNRTAFHAVLSDLKRTSPDLVLHGGDLAQGGSHPAEIIDQIRALGWPGVQGNTDEVLWAPESLPEMPSMAALRQVIAETISTSRSMLTDEQMQWLKSLPHAYGCAGVTVVHAAPESLWRSPLADAPDAELATIYGPLNAPVVAYGHIHQPYIRKVQRFTVANSGSVSLSYDGDTRASYLLVEDAHVSIRRVEYDVETAIRELTESGMPHADWISRILRTAKYCAPE